MKSAIGIDIQELSELYSKRDLMFQEIGLLLEDVDTIREIGTKTYIEYEVEVLRPMINMFGFHDRCPNELWKYRGHKLSLIRYYCDLFNAKSVHA